MIKPYILAIRPRQWTKNLLLFAGIIFAQKFFESDAIIKSFTAFINFCMLSASIYLVNDIKDIETDRAHPEKKHRPIASGKISVGTAWVYFTIMAVLAIGLAYTLGIKYFTVAMIYFVVMLLYSFKLKHIVIMDLMIIAGGFVARAVAGAFAVDVMISSWLLVCTTSLALFLVIAKRRHEVILLGEDAISHRKILEEYGEKFLDQMTPVVTATTVLTYMFYTVDSETVTKFGTNHLIFTTPFVLYGIFRYLYIVYQKNMGGRPEEILLSDPPMIIAIILWVVTAMIIIY